ncbi:hypothetical protein ACFL0W_05140 [Nanoarchaeota archaeon]
MVKTKLNKKAMEAQTVGFWLFMLFLLLIILIAVIGPARSFIMNKLSYIFSLLKFGA